MVIFTGELLGRDEELAALVRALEYAVTATGTAVVITGEPGIGKSALLQAVLEEDAATRFGVVRARASRLESQLPFASLVRAVRRHAETEQREHLEGLLAGVGAESAGRLQVADAIEDWFERRALDGPTILAFDDLQWADEGTFLVLHRLLGLAETLPFVLLATARPSPRPPGLLDLEQALWSTGGRNLRLGPLDIDACQKLAARALKGVGDAEVDVLVAGAGGNPLFITEVAAAARSGGADGAAPVDAALRDTVLRRVDQFDHDLVQLLRDAAVLGTDFDLRHLAILRETSETDLAGRLDPAVQADILRVDAATGLSFRHDLIRDAIQDSIDATLRAARHREVVLALDAAGLAPEEWVAHLEPAEWRGVPEASDLHRRASRAARHLDHQLREELLLKAIEYATEPSTDLLAEFWRAAWNHRDAVRPTLIARAVGGLPLDEWVLLARQLHPNRELTEALLAVKPANASQEAPADLAFLEAQVAILDEGGTDRVRDLADLAVRLAEELSADVEADDPYLLMCTLDLRAGVAYYQTRNDDLREDAYRALRLARRLGLTPHEEIGILSMATANGPGEGEQLELHVDAKRRLWSLAEEISHPALLSNLADQANQMFVLGAYDEFQTLADRVLHERLDRTGDNPWYLAYVAGGLTALSRTDDADVLLDRADAAIDHYERESADGLLGQRLAMKSVVLQVRAVRHHALGDPVAAGDALASALEASSAAREQGRDLRAANTSALALAVMIGRDDLEGRLAQLLGPATGSDLDEIQHRWMRAILDRDVPALRLASEAMDAWWAERRAANLRAWGLGSDRATWPMWPGQTDPREVEAFVAARHGDRDWAIQRLEEALVGAQDLGPSATRRVRAALRELGVKRITGRKTAAEQAGWGSVTDAEWAVLDLVEQGLVYRQVAERLFLSRRTVESHMSRVFAKIGVRSRSHLTMVLRDGEGAESLATWRERH